MDRETEDRLFATVIVIVSALGVGLMTAAIIFFVR